MRDYFQNVLLSNGLKGFRKAVQHRPQMLVQVYGVILQQLKQAPVLAAGHPVAEAQMKELHPAMLPHCLLISTPGDGSCLFHAVSISICGTRALTPALHVLSAVFLAHLEAQLQELGVEETACAAGIEPIADYVSR